MHGMFSSRLQDNGESASRKVARKPRGGGGGGGSWERRLSGAR